jgi:hypothetical protein
MTEIERKQLRESGFYPGFLQRLHTLELVKLQHELRIYPEDKVYLDQVLTELKQRNKNQ